MIILPKIESLNGIGYDTPLFKPTIYIMNSDMESFKSKIVTYNIEKVSVGTFNLI